MSFRKNKSKIPIIVDGRGDRFPKFAGIKTKSTSTTASTTSTKITCASTVTSSSIAETSSTKAKSTSSWSANKSAARLTVAEIKAASKQDEFDDELESMLSLTQTLSFWDGDDDEDGDTLFANSYDNTSYSGNTCDSSSTFDDSLVRGHDKIASCGDGFEDTLETFVITGRAISSALRNGSKSVNSLFSGKLKQQVVEKEGTRKKLDEEMSMKREAQLREEMITARYEISNVANLWREK